MTNNPAIGKGPVGRKWAAFFNKLAKGVGLGSLVHVEHPLNLYTLPGGKAAVNFKGYILEPYMVKASCRGDGQGYFASPVMEVYAVVPNATDSNGLWHVVTDQVHSVDGRFTRGWYPGGTYVWGYRHPASRTVYITTPGITGLVRGTMTGAATFTPLAVFCGNVDKYDSEYITLPEDWPCQNPWAAAVSDPVWGFWDEYGCSFIVTPECPT